MKGVVFREFLEMVDKAFSPAVTEAIILKSGTPSGGAYTSVGYYPHSEMVSLITALSAETGNEASGLIRAFGRYLLGRFVELFPRYFHDAHDAFELAEKLDQHFHVEVRKLYGDAELPELPTERLSEDELILTYRSVRGMADLAEGLLEGVVAHYGQPIEVVRNDLPHLEGGIQCVQFRLHRLTPSPIPSVRH